MALLLRKCSSGKNLSYDEEIHLWERIRNSHTDRRERRTKKKSEKVVVERGEGEKCVVWEKRGGKALAKESK